MVTTTNQILGLTASQSTASNLVSSASSGLISRRRRSGGGGGSSSSAPKPSPSAELRQIDEKINPPSKPPQPRGNEQIQSRNLDIIRSFGSDPNVARNVSAPPTLLDDIDVASSNVVRSLGNFGIESISNIQTRDRTPFGVRETFALDRDSTQRAKAIEFSLAGGLLLGGGLSGAGSFLTAQRTSGFRGGVANLARDAFPLKFPRGRFSPSVQQSDFQTGLVAEQPIAGTPFRIQAGQARATFDGENIATISRAGVQTRTKTGSEFRGVQTIERPVVDIDVFNQPRIRTQTITEPFVGKSIRGAGDVSLVGTATPRGTSVNFARGTDLGKIGDTDFFGGFNVNPELQVGRFGFVGGETVPFRAILRPQKGTDFLGFRVGGREPNVLDFGRGSGIDKILGGGGQTARQLPKTVVDDFPIAGANLKQQLPKLSGQGFSAQSPLVSVRDFPNLGTFGNTQGFATQDLLFTPQPSRSNVDFGGLSSVADLSGLGSGTRQRQPPLLSGGTRQNPLTIDLTAQKPDTLQPQKPKQPPSFFTQSFFRQEQRSTQFAPFRFDIPEFKPFVPRGGFLTGGGIIPRRPSPVRKRKRRFRRTPSLIALPTQLNIKAPRIRIGETTGLTVRGLLQ